jgi:hypothetical protein
MRLRVLQVIEATVGFPLKPGRTIDIAKLTPEMRGWVELGRAEIVRDEDQEDSAVVAGGERAVTKGRRESS